MNNPKQKRSRRRDNMIEIKEEDFHKAFEAAANVLGADPAYFGEEGDAELERQLMKLGYRKEDLNKSL